jgi:ABC-type transporter Mla subunit MlaD
MQIVYEFWPTVIGWLSQATTALDGILGVFKTPEVAIGMAISILGLAGIVLLYLVVRVVPIWLQLRRLTILARRSNGSFAKFKSAYPTISDAVAQTKYLAHSWREFCETLVISDDDLDEPIRNTARPHVFINVHALATSGKSFRFLQAVPNYFVGVGLILTFVGLVAAIYFASAGVASDDVAEAQLALRHLLSAATFKFMTSIAGLFSSLILSICYRISMQSLQGQLDHFCEALERGMLFATRESIAFDQLQELKEQTGQLKRFNTDFAIEVGKVLEDRMGDSLSIALKPLQEAVEQLAGNMGEMNQGALADMVATFGETLKSSAGEEMRSLVAALQGITQSLGQAGDDLQSRTAGAADGLSQRINEAAETLRETLEPLAEQIGSFQATVQSMDERMTAQREAFLEVAENVRSITQDAGGTIQQLGDAVSPLNDVSIKLSETADGISAVGESIAQAQTNILQTSSEMGDAISSMESTWADYRNRFEDVDESLANAIGQLTTGADAYRKHIEEFVSGLDRELNKAVSTLGGGIEALTESIEDLIEQRPAN